MGWTFRGLFVMSGSFSLRQKVSLRGNGDRLCLRYFRLGRDNNHPRHTAEEPSTSVGMLGASGDPHIARS